MTEQDGGNPHHFVATKNSRRFGEMCDACRQARVVGLGYGPPGTGKQECRTVFYTPPVSASIPRIEKTARENLIIGPG